MSVGLIALTYFEESQSLTSKQVYYDDVGYSIYLYFLKQARHFYAVTYSDRSAERSRPALRLKWTVNIHSTERNGGDRDTQADGKRERGRERERKREEPMGS